MVCLFASISCILPLLHCFSVFSYTYRVSLVFLPTSLSCPSQRTRTTRFCNSTLPHGVERITCRDAVLTTFFKQSSAAKCELPFPCFSRLVSTLFIVYAGSASYNKHAVTVPSRCMEDANERTSWSSLSRSAANNVSDLLMTDD